MRWNRSRTNITKEYKYISLGKTNGIITTAPGKNGKTIVEKREIVCWSNGRACTWSLCEAQRTNKRTHARRAPMIPKEQENKVYFVIVFSARSHNSYNNFRVIWRPVLVLMAHNRQA